MVWSCVALRLFVAESAIMATCANDKYVFTIKHLGTQASTVVHVAHNVTVEYVILKASASLELEVDERPKLELVHQGDILPKNQKIQDIFKHTRTTCCFLQICDPQIRPRLNRTIPGFGRYQGYCSDCKTIAALRPLYNCSKCNAPGLVIMEDSVNQFEDDLDLLMGSCGKCNEQVKPRMTYECAASDDRHKSVIFLPHLRENLKNLPCMKCGKKEEVIIRFTCGHTMCLVCFSGMCQMKLDKDEFKTYPSGYSVCCPADDRLCVSSPIVDPHHFYLVDGDKKFYKKFSEKVFAELQEEQKQLHELKCTTCSNRLDLIQMCEAEVTRPEGAPAPPTQTGGGFSRILKLLRLNSTQSQPKIMRRQIKCDHCQSLYCGECKLKWHEGDCNNMTAEEKAAATQFTINPDAAKKSKWD